MDRSEILTTASRLQPAGNRRPAERRVMSFIPSRKEQTMLRIRLLAALAGALLAGLAVATIAGAHGYDGDSSSDRSYAFGVGNFGPGCWQTDGGPFCVPFNYTARILGVKQGESHRAWGAFERRNNVTGGGFTGVVTCMSISGNRASVGGLLTGQASASPFLVYVEDNGTLGTTTPDQVSALAVFAPEEALPVADFPRVCPSADSTLGYLPLTSGDVTVSDEAVGLAD
jgi:hypothetical protein